MRSSHFIHTLAASTSRLAARLKALLQRMDILALALPIAMIVPNVLLDITDPMPVGGLIANILVPTSVYLLLTTSLRRTGIAPVAVILFILMNGFQISVLYLFGESIIAIDMLINCVTTDTGEASELLGNLLLPIIGSLVLYLPFVGWGIYGWVKGLRTTDAFRRKWRRIALYGLVIGLTITALTTIFVKRYTPVRDLYPVNVCCNIGIAGKRIYQSINYPHTSAAFSYHAVDTRADDTSKRRIYVLFIGETSRSLNWQLFGYDRPTNPALTAIADRLTLCPRALTQSNTTHKCVPLMLTYDTPAGFDSLIYRKSIVTAFNEAGFTTSFFSNQPHNHSYTQYFSEEADNCVYIDKADRYDHKLRDLLVGQLADTTLQRQFIILHGYGSHFNYRDRYPREYAYFTPDDASNATFSNRQQLINAYDNSIRYTDRLIADIISDLDATDAETAFMFVSDHGEDLYDDSRHRLLHASPLPTYYQLRVPLIYWFSDVYRQAQPAVVDAVEANSSRFVAPSQSIFHTLIDIAGLSTPYYAPSRSMASQNYVEPQAVFLNDYNEAVPLQQSGMRQVDLDLLRSHSLLP